MARIRRPSPAMAVALVALFAALSGGAYAAATISGKNIKNNSVTGKDVKQRSLTGKDVRNNSLSGRQIKESGLGKVPSAGTADTAATAGTAANAQALGGIPAGALAGGARVVTTGLRKVQEEGPSVVLLRSGPFEVGMDCFDQGSGPELYITARSSEPGSSLDGDEGVEATDVAEIESTTAFEHRVNENVNLVAPSGAVLDLVIQYGVNGLGADCFASLSGFRN